MPNVNPFIDDEKKKELEDYLAMKFGPSPSAFDVGLSKSTATVPVGVQNTPESVPPFQLSSLEPKIDTLAMLQEKQPVSIEDVAQGAVSPMSSVKPGVPPMARDAQTVPSGSKPTSFYDPKMIDEMRRLDQGLSSYDEKIAAARRAGPNWGQVIGMGFAGLGEAMSGAPYLQSTIKQAESDYGREVENLKAEKSEFEERDSRNPDSYISQKYRELAARYTSSKPESFAGMSAYQINRVLPTIKDMYDAELKAEQLRESRAFQKKQLELKGEELDIMRGEKQAKREEESKKRVIPGFKYDGSVAIDDVEARDLRKGMAAWEKFTTGIDRYHELVQKYGTGEFMDQRASGEMETLANALQLDVKKLAQLGVLSKSDEPFIKRQIPDPSFFARGGKTLATLETSKKIFTDDMLSNMKGRGYHPDEEMTKRLSGGAGAATQPEGDGITVTNGTETFTIPAGPNQETDLLEAESEGFRRI